jgi:hypothetical protein
MTRQLMKCALCLLGFISISRCAYAHVEVLGGAYTALEGPTCIVESDDPETGAQYRYCPGIAGYSVLVQESDDRVSLTIISPSKRSLPLDFWGRAVPGFLTLGRQIEWRSIARHRTGKQFGIVVRVDTVDQADVGHPKPVSFLIVARIAESAACVTAKIPAEQPYALLTARQVADDPSRRCLPSM